MKKEVECVENNTENYEEELTFAEKVGMSLMDSPLKRCAVGFAFIAIVIGLFISTMSSVTYNADEKKADKESVSETVAMDLTVEDATVIDAYVDVVEKPVVKDEVEEPLVEEKASETVKEEVKKTTNNDVKEPEKKKKVESNKQEEPVDNVNFMYGLDLPPGGPDDSDVISSEPVQDIVIYEPIETPQAECTNHDLVLTKTELLVECDLYNYVTDWFKCSKCGYQETYDHRADNNVSGSKLDSAANEIISLVNNLRASQGLNTLWTDSGWDAWADKRADELTVSYGHNGWTNAIGSTYTLAENIAAGCESGTDFFNAFCGSASHYNAMLLEEAVGIAVSVSVDSNGTPYCAMCIIANE